MFFTKTKKLLVLFLVAAIGIVSPKASVAKTYYVKKSVKVSTTSGKKAVLPQYAVAKIKYRKIKVQEKRLGICSKKIINHFVFDTPDYIKIFENPIPLSEKKPTKTKKVVKYVVVVGMKVKIGKKKLTTKKPRYVTKKVPKNGIKCYMSYRAITAKGSPQYKLQHTKAYTDPKTGVRMVDGRYCIAMGSSAATKIGTKIDLIFASGKVVHAILGDQKAGAAGGWIHPDGSAVEFLVDMGTLPRYARRMGDLSVLKKFKGRITKIRVYKK